MTSSPLSVSGPVTACSPHGARAPQLSGLGSLLTGDIPTDMWFMACCHRCDPDFAQPFAVEDERDEWAAAHVIGTGHVVQLLIEVQHVELSEHTTAMLRCEDGKSSWLCTADECQRWNGPFVTAQLAVASFRSHRMGR